MARKSRVNIPESIPAGQMVYDAGAYARLSAEDVDCDSLENQILLIENYVSGNPQLRIAGQYTDNGLTGQTFDRDGFQRMMDDIKARKINCVVVKDLSRFARNYIEACEYLEKIFPFMGVRFISVNDGFDSDRDDPTDVIIMLKNLMNHEYAKDISRKILSVFSTKRKNGEFLGCCVPYGYKRSAVHRNKLEPDDETAHVIRDIFTWKSEGISHSKITRRLNEMGILSPAQHLQYKGELKPRKYTVSSLWNIKTVKNILHNKVYIGHLVQGRRKSVIRDGKMKEVIAPESEWDIAENAHEPIVDMDLWNKVHAVMDERRDAYLENLGKTSPDETENALKGLVICGNCGTRMSRSKDVLPSGGVTYRFICYIRAQNFDLVCDTKAIREDNLLNIVHKVIREEIRRTVDVKAILEDLDRDGAREKAGLSHQIDTKKKRISQLRVLRMSLVESLAVKRITEADFVFAKAKYEAEETQLRQDIEAIQARLQDETLTIKNKWLTSFGRFMDEKVITREMAVTLVQKIVAHDNEHIDVYLNFGNDRDRLTKYIGEVEA